MNQLNHKYTMERLNEIRATILRLRQHHNVQAFLRLDSDDMRMVRALFTGDLHGSAGDIYSLAKIATQCDALIRRVEILQPDHALVSDDVLQELADAVGGIFTVFYPSPEPGRLIEKRANVMRMDTAEWYAALAAGLDAVKPCAVQVNIVNKGMHHGDYPQS